MVVDVKPEVPVVTNTNGVRRLIGRYNHAKAIKDLWTSTFEECYEMFRPCDKEKRELYTKKLYSKLQRQGLLERDADRLIRNDENQVIID